LPDLGPVVVPDADRRAADDARSRVREYESRLDRLTLVCAAMWSLLQEKTGLTEAELLKKVEEIDLSDGVKDGKVRKQAMQCPRCQRTMSSRHARCLYCGAEKLDYVAFDGAR
jgi:ribosomal protein S27AE